MKGKKERMDGMGEGEESLFFHHWSSSVVYMCVCSSFISRMFRIHMVYILSDVMLFGVLLPQARQSMSLHQHVGA